jgi:hypothetical protein
MRVLIQTHKVTSEQLREFEEHEKEKEPPKTEEEFLNRIRDHIMMMLFAESADFEKKLANGDVALMFNARFGHLMAAEDVLDRGAYTDATDDHGQSALHVAASRGYGDIVHLLLCYEANKNMKDEDGNTPRDLAEKNGFHKVIDILNATPIN